MDPPDGSTAGIVGALLGWSATSSTRQPHRRPPRRRPRHRRQPLWVPDHLAIVLGLILALGGLVAIAHSIQGGLPGALGQAGLGRRGGRRHRGPHPGHLDGLAAKQLAEAWATAPPQEQATALRLVLAEETINFAPAPRSTSCLPA
jgi:hypothetical protein